MSWIALLLPLLVPPALVALLALRITAPFALRLAPWAAAPALAAALFAADGRLEMSWVLLGTHLELDGTRRVFLLLTAGLWTAAGVYAGAYHAADPDRRRYFGFHLATLAGNLALVLAGDAVTFYLCFVLMSFAAYGLVIHAGTRAARRAATVYIVLVLIGEALILPGLWSAVSHAPGLLVADVAAGALAAGPATITALALGFAIKAGAVPLHVWLPLAHPVAPTPASAVLSGAMIKAGAIGWILLLPLGHALPVFAWLFIAGGLLSAFYGALAGVLQSRPKTVLAYSSISQMGLVMVAVGAGFRGAEAWALGGVAVGGLALHHGLAKGALFLGVGVVEHAGHPARRRLARVLLALPALALAGAPLSSGFAAKLLVTAAAYDIPGLAPLLSLAAIGTTLLMARFLWLMRAFAPKDDTRHAGLWAPWLALIAAGFALVLAPGLPTGGRLAALADPAALWAALWPIAAGLAISAAALALTRHGGAMPAIPEGDLLWPVWRAWRRLRAIVARLIGQLAEPIAARTTAITGHMDRQRAAAADWLGRGEARLARQSVIAFNVLVLLAAFALLAAVG